MSRDCKQGYIFIAVLSSILLLCYGQLLGFENPVRFDDQIILKPLEKVNSIEDYLQQIREGKLADVQPLRDLTFLVNLAAQKSVPSIFLLTNFLIFGILLLGIRKLFTQISCDKNKALICMFIVALHPIFSQTVPWIAARKHLLSVMFIVFAHFEMGKYFFKNDKLVSHTKITLLYLCSILGHPITLLWPLNGILPITRFKKEWKKWIPIFVAMVVVGIGNYWYYSHVYFQISHADKILPFQGVGTVVSALARNFLQIILPYKMAFAYDPESLSNMLGIPLLVFWHALIYKYLSRQEFFYIILLYWPTQILTNFIPTPIFVSDTYLLLPLISVAVSLIMLSKKTRINFKYALLVISLAFGLKTYISIKRWESPEKFWEISYQEEDSCINLLWHTREKWLKHRGQEAIELGHKIFRRRCFFSGKEYEDMAFNIFVSSIIFEPDLSEEEKIKQIKRLHIIGRFESLIVDLIRVNSEDNARIKNIIDDAMVLGLDPESTIFIRLKERCSEGQDQELRRDCQKFFWSR